MTATARLLLDVAARRWPADMRTEQRLEWEAEMHTIHHDTSTSPLLRSLRGLRFAFSLAAAPPADDGHGVPRGWRELLPERGRRLTPVLLLVVATMVTAGLGATLPAFAFLWSGRSVVDPDGVPHQTTVATWAVGIGIVLLATALAFAGVRLGARFPMPNLLKAFGVVTATLLVLTVATPGWPSFLRPEVDFTPLVDAIALTAWGTAMFAVTALAVRLLRKGPWAALAVSAGSLAVLDLVAMIFATPLLTEADARPGTLAESLHGLLWFPLSLVSIQSGVSGNEVDDGLATTLSPSMGMLVAVSTFTVAYVLRSRKTAPATAEASTPAVRAARPLAPLRWTAGALGVAAFGSWVWTLAFATHDDAITSWALEARLTAVLATVLAGTVVLTGLGRPLLTAVLATPLLVAADLLLDRFGVHGTIGAVQAAGTGAVLLAVAWWLGDRILPGRGADTARPLTFVAVLAAFAVTGVFGSVNVPTDTAVWDYPPQIVIASVALTVLSGLAALGARRRHVTIARAIIGLTVRTALVTTALAFTGGLGYGIAVGPVLAAWTLATIRWEGRARSAGGWAAALVGTALASVPILFVSWAITGAIGAPLWAVAGYGKEIFPGDVLMPAVTLLGAGIAWLVTTFAEGGASAARSRSREPLLRGGGVTDPVLP
ncbi:hypothetical protein [Phytomonospora endophytica]|uniref:Uncharacterized protein n=1 Tax=Phytomonospora endophytica TaxID=714109 RepID=A0A841FIZ1_9ACTN|nr:hypothetical protein [Phytomonospora endophytica]MBB6034913.1 hypothetical protein [Phytomonospora endophytica]GIG70617.1 hypothetical protein Pen01_69120 [Phytomonospora endophytica]